MTNELALRVAALRALRDQAGQAFDDAKTELETSMEKGDTLAVFSPIDRTEIGSVSKSKPKPAARISDLTAFAAWVGERHPDEVTSSYEVTGTTKQVTDVLFVHAPHLIRRVPKVNPALVAQILTQSSKLGEPVGPEGETDVPGIVVETADGRLSCRVTEDAFAAVLALIRAGRMPLELLAGGEA
jgi:hypothetical protein